MLASMYQESVGYQLKRAQHAFRLALDAELDEVGLSLAQYAALAALKEQPDASNAVLARLCFVTPQTMNDLLASLVKERLVQRRPHPEHGRIITLRLTEKGTRLLAGADRVAANVETRMMARISADERKRLLELLRTLAETMAKYKFPLRGPTLAS